MKKQLLLALLVVLCGDAFAQTWSPVGSTNFSPGQANYTSIIMGKNDTPYVVYGDLHSAGYPTVMKYDGSAWVAVGTPGFATGRLPTIAAAPDGTLYVAYEELSGRFNGPATVMKFNGSSWETVGSPAFTTVDADEPKIAIDKNGTPFVAYISIDTNVSAVRGFVTVMKYNGSSWVTVDTARFSNGSAAYTSIAIDNAGTPFVVYDDGSNGSKATVMKYDGSHWITVGSAGFSAGNAGKVDIAIDKNGVPYVVYEDRGTLGGTIFLNGRASVMRFNGSSWIAVGSPGFSAGDHIDDPSIAIDASGTPYVAFEDVPTSTGGNSPCTVMKYDGSSWVTVGDAGFSLVSVGDTHIALDASGVPYVVYSKSGGARANVMKFGNNTGVKTLANSTETNITVSPNPNNGSFTVNVTTEQAQLTITNMIGQKVKAVTSKGAGAIDIDLNEPAGVYFLTIAATDGKTTYKIVINNK